MSIGNRRTRLNFARKMAALGGLAALLTAGAACSPGYVLRAGYEQAKLLNRRQPIARVVADPATPPEQRAKLELVVRARDFAADSLQLDAGRSYTMFAQLDSDTLLLVVSAAYPDRFRAHTWWFPIVGRVPYKGFFRQRDAWREAERLEARGFDTYVRPAGAFSTLGWFNDPLVSTLLRYDSVSLANTVIHEIFHNTLYLSGQAMFNESAAQFVGSRGAIAFFCGSAFGPETRECSRATDAWHDELVFGAYLSALVAELEALYGREELTTEQKLELREEIFRRRQDEFAREVRPRLRVATYTGFTSNPLNNATLISRRLYYHRLDLFEALYQDAGGDLPLAIRRLVAAAEAGPDDPFGAVEAAVGAR
jgi:predicted aminopeptidase